MNSLNSLNNASNSVLKNFESFIYSDASKNLKLPSGVHLMTRCFRKHDTTKTPNFWHIKSPKIFGKALNKIPGTVHRIFLLHIYIFKEEQGNAIICGRPASHLVYYSTNVQYIVGSLLGNTSRSWKHFTPHWKTERTAFSSATRECGAKLELQFRFKFRRNSWSKCFDSLKFSC